MSKPAPATYRTTNWRAYNAALRRRGSLLVWFDPEMEWLAVPRGWAWAPGDRLGRSDPDLPHA